MMTDDQNRNEMRWMPKARRLLGGHGVTFPKALSPAPLCCPARAMTITGQYGQNNGVQSNFGPFGGFEALVDEGNTLALWLQRAGYRTAMVGKYLNGYEGEHTPRQLGWDHWNPAVANVYSYHDTVFLEDDGERVTYPGNVTPVISDRTAEFIREFSATDDPFFVWASHIAPHGARSADETVWSAPRPSAEHRDVLTEVRPPSLDKPSFNVAGEGAEPYPRPPMGPEKLERVRTNFTGRLQTLQDVDDSVEDLVRVLRETGELPNTYIVFVSDNGFLLGEHRLIEKNVLYREDMDIPLLIRVPGASDGDVSSVAATTVDLAPTIVDLAGATAGRTMDGRSFAPVLGGEPSAWRSTQLIQSGSSRVEGPLPGWQFRGIRTPRYTYMRRAHDGAQFLFDRRTDPFEIVNVATVVRYRPVLRALRDRHDQLIHCAGATCESGFPPLPLPR